LATIFSNLVASDFNPVGLKVYSLFSSPPAVEPGVSIAASPSNFYINFNSSSSTAYHCLALVSLAKICMADLRAARVFSSFLKK